MWSSRQEPIKNEMELRNNKDIILKCTQGKKKWKEGNWQIYDDYERRQILSLFFSYPILQLTVKMNKSNKGNLVNSKNKEWPIKWVPTFSIKYSSLSLYVSRYVRMRRGWELSQRSRKWENGSHLVAETRKIEWVAN